MKRRFISARRLDKEIIEVTYRYWFRTRTIKLLYFMGDFYEIHSDEKFRHFDTLLYNFKRSKDKTININDLK